MTPDVTRTLAISLLVAAGSGAMKLSAAATTFWFGGVVTSINDAGKAIPFPVAEGMAFTGRVSYDPTLLTSSETTVLPSGNSGQYYFETTGGFSVQLQLGGHLISNNTAPAGSYTGEIFIGNNSNNEDLLLYSVIGGGETFIDGKAFVQYPQFSMIDISLSDSTKVALTDAKLPTTVPDLSRYAGSREMRWITAIDDGGPTRIFGVTGEITVLGSEEIVILSRTRVGPDTLKLSWPTWNPGYTLQVSTNLAQGNWQTATNAVTKSTLEYSATVSTAGAPRYYRLRK